MIPRQPWRLVFREQCRFGVPDGTGQEHPAPATLWQAKAVCIDDSIGPFVVQFFERRRDQPQGRASRELSDEWHVLKYEPWDTTTLQQPEDLPNETRPCTLDTLLSPDRGQILAGEPCADDLDSTDIIEVANVVMNCCVREARPKYRLRSG